MQIWAAPAAAIALALAVSACSSDADDPSSDGPDPGSAGAAALEVVAEDIAFVPATLSAPAGPVDITYTNADGVPHNLVLKAADGETVARSGEPSADADPVTVAADLGSGEYSMICEVHPSMGATLTVG